MIAREVAPMFAGTAMQTLKLGAPILAAATLKIVYDGLLYVAFRKVKPPEEKRGGTNRRRVASSRKRASYNWAAIFPAGPR